MNVALASVVVLQLVALVVLVTRERRRSRAEGALRASEEKFRHLVEDMPVVIWTARPDATLDYLNRECMEFTGVPVEKLRDEGWLDSVHPDDRERCIATYTPAFEGRKPFLLEYRMRRADGAYGWLLASGVPRYAPDGSFAGFLGCDVDITARKEAEDRIRASQLALEQSHSELRHLAGRLIEAQDAERARLARDLHDDVSQQVAGLSIALSGLARRMGELQVGEELRAEAGRLHQRTATLAQNVRHLSHDLHPTVLRHVGLVAALSSCCAELERTHGVVMRCTAEGDFGSLGPEVALCLYRIAQEALRNVIAHAGARRADVRLLRSGDEAELTISDDGRGFDVSSSLGRSKGLGLVSIAERVRFVGGTVRVESASNEGTRVRVHVPAPATETVKGGAAAGAGGLRELSLS